MGDGRWKPGAGRGEWGVDVRCSKFWVQGSRFRVAGRRQGAGQSLEVRGQAQVRSQKADRTSGTPACGFRRCARPGSHQTSNSQHRTWNIQQPTSRNEQRATAKHPLPPVSAARRIGWIPFGRRSSCRGVRRSVRGADPSVQNLQCAGGRRADPLYRSGVESSFGDSRCVGIARLRPAGAR